MTNRLIWAALFLGCISSSSAFADSLVVQTCGMLPLAYAPGSIRLDTVDINGNKCLGPAGGGTSNVNVIQFGSSPVATGTGASGAGIPRVTISNDSALAPNQSVNVNQFGGTAVATGTGASGAGIARVTVSNDSSILATPATPANWGLGTIGAAVPTTAMSNGGDAQSSEPSKATTGNLTNIFLDLVGKLITSPYANRENMLRCAVTLTASTAATTCTGMGAQGANIKIYITDLTCTRSDAGTTSATMTLNDSATTIIDMTNNGGGGGFSHSFNVPLVVAANTPFQVQSGTSLTSVHCSAAGFSGY